MFKYLSWFLVFAVVGVATETLTPWQIRRDLSLFEVVYSFRCLSCCN